MAMPLIDPTQGYSPIPSPRISPGGAAPSGLEGRSRRRGYGFGPKERRLYDFLRAKAAKKTVALRRQPQWAVVKHVWGRDADGRRKRRFLVRLRQLQLAVNRKLEQAGSPLKIRAAREGFLTLVHLDDLSRRRNDTASEGGEPVRLGDRTRRGRSAGERVEACRRDLLGHLERGVRRSKELKRLCEQEGHSYRSFSEARRRLELQPARRRDAMGYYWEVVWPVPEPPDPAVTSQPAEGDTLRTSPLKTLSPD